MKYLNTYENFEYLGNQIINKEEAIDIINNLKEFSIDDKSIFRGIHLDNDYYIIDPKKNRRQRTIGVLPTLIMKYNELWKNFPVRQNSIFCSNSNSVEFYGKIFRVIPFDNSMWGVSSKENYKSSFEKISNELLINVEGLFDKTIQNMYKQFVGKTFINSEDLFYKNDSVSKDNYEIMLYQIDEIFLKYKQNPINVPERWQKILNFNTAKEFIDYYFEPYSNGFKCLNYRELQEELNSKYIFLNPKELWTDSKCLLISNDIKL